MTENTPDAYANLEWIERTETQTYEYMWEDHLNRGHYTDTVARNPGDKLIARRVTTKSEGVVIGQHHYLGRVMASDGELPTTEIETPLARGPWINIGPAGA